MKLLSADQLQEITSADYSHTLSVSVPATSANLGPGFDCLGIALSLFNTLRLYPNARDELTTRGEGAREMHDKNTSIAHESARAAWQKLGFVGGGIVLEMENAIPFARGLGSSSAAIVGGLVAANEWARKYRGVFLSNAELLDLATQIEGHPDNVAPALLGGLAVAATREDGRVFAASPPLPHPFGFVVWIPSVELSTKEARAVLPESYSRADAVFNLSRAALLVAGLSNGDKEAVRESLRDKIHQDFRAPLVPGWEVFNRAAQELNALGTTLSGAGPTILFWLEDASGAAEFARGMENIAVENGLEGRVLILQVAKGARVLGN